MNEETQVPLKHVLPLLEMLESVEEVAPDFLDCDEVQWSQNIRAALDEAAKHGIKSPNTP